MDTHELSRAPFTASELFGKETELGYVPPCISAFVGADLTAAVLASDMANAGYKAALLCDIGTNGEIALYKDGVVYATSTAAGPAFEGVAIKMGSTAIPGAIEHVSNENGEIKISVIGNAEAKSICGSGILEAVSTGLEFGVIDESGRMSGEFKLSESVSVFPEDVREIQSAKAAIAAGIATLFSASNTSPEEIERCYIAGAFGKKCSEKSILRLGLLPKELSGKLEFIGNAALDGAAMMLLSDEKREELKEILKKAKHISLGGNPVFNEAFIDNISFE